VHTHWQWGAKTIVISHTVPLIRARERYELGSCFRFPCRGNYRLSEVVLASGFPLGMVTARRRAVQHGISALVLPAARAVLLPGQLDISHDPQGNQTTRRLGQSFELGTLRQYVAGEPLGRVNWRASARAGELVIQHFQQSSSPRLHLVTDIPPEHELADPATPTEHAIRIAAGISRQALTAGVRVRAYLPQQTEPLQDNEGILRALASAAPDSLPLTQAINRACGRLSEGDQLVAVVSPRRDAAGLVRDLSIPALGKCPVMVYIATAPNPPAADLALSAILSRTLSEAGFQVFSTYPS